MAQSNNILEELKALGSSLAGNCIKPPFEVPAGYFDALPSQVIAKIKLLSQTSDEELTGVSPLLAGIPKEMPYAVPNGYFESLEISLASIITDNKSAKEEVENLSPLTGWH